MLFVNLFYACRLRTQAMLCKDQVFDSLCLALLGRQPGTTTLIHRATLTHNLTVNMFHAFDRASKPEEKSVR